MHIKGRGKNALIMSIVWIIVPIITAVYISSGRVGNEMIILMLMCAMFHFLGVILYTGSYEGFAGFNTMSKEEIKEYDLEKVTSFLGISWVLGSYIFFFILLIGFTMFSISTAIVLSTILFTVIAILSSVYSGVGKRFKAQN